ncbi:conserved hypothetical protein [Uncinocarpus reesii 1704]|uniref:UDP-N-acetylglucosamine transferase subunit ALG14 n=1 Tax=Uncinocarpus reesii (strain UAMH 1704) TaxID=336963 RepID=C4JJX4_UNCRE|nr:uncharacterized protein UREG_01931 [Uncinocarpus reesii 1704]EEP77082.1 conserved hypothetical protein [Uncinocarpus reesii 1704]
MLASASAATAILVVVGLAIFFTLSLIHLVRLQNASTKHAKSRRAIHLLVVLGSGGHTEEMLSMLRYARLDPEIYSKRTYLVSSGDLFSARKASEFEHKLSMFDPSTGARFSKGSMIAPRTKKRNGHLNLQTDHEIVTVPKARNVHQSFLTAPFSTLHCLWACFQVLRGKHADQIRLNPAQSRPTTCPDLILTNGPGIAVCVIVAARILRFLSWLLVLSPPPFEKPDKLRRSKGSRRRYLRTIFVESWARVTTLSLSGKLVLPIADRFLVQWEPLEGYSSWNGKKAEFIWLLFDTLRTSQANLLARNVSRRERIFDAPKTCTSSKRVFYPVSAFDKTIMSFMAA